VPRGCRGGRHRAAGQSGGAVLAARARTAGRLPVRHRRARTSAGRRSGTVPGCVGASKPAGGQSCAKSSRFSCVLSYTSTASKRIGTSVSYRLPHRDCTVTEAVAPTGGRHR